LSFVIPGVPNEAVARHLDKNGIAVRAGHHCAQPAIRHFGLESSVRPSLAFYNTRAEVDALVLALRSLKRS
jgi:cysteine desulfurase/selenocysteine lyase